MKHAKDLASRDLDIEQHRAKSEKLEMLESELRALREKIEAGLPPSPLGEHPRLA